MEYDEMVEALAAQLGIPLSVAKCALDLYDAIDREKVEIGLFVAHTGAISLGHMYTNDDAALDEEDATQPVGEC